ncbi:MAG: hypothetical protein IJY27_02235 [Clostridia bacterium]|nr:hypothetical protein [Clostridia bacterium]
MKRFISILLCLLMVIPLLVACSNDDAKQQEEEEEDKGAYIKMYLADVVYDLDPAYSLNNKSTQKLTSLMFSGLTKLNENGKVVKDLAKSIKITENEEAKEYKMIIVLNDTYWSDGISVDAADVIYAWKRILDVENSNSAAPLLFDIKNARAVVEGDCSIDDLGISDPAQNTLEITFEGKIDYDQFLLNLTSPALVPLREDIVEKNNDWAKKSATIVCSGPFTLRSTNYTPGEESMTLERNAYYFRDKEKDAIDVSVTPYRLIIDFSATDEELQTMFNNGELFYIGEIPLSLRASYADVAEITDEMSTHTYFLNQEAYILNGGKDANGNPTGDFLFANENVRKALSLAIDRQAIADAVVFAKAATGLVPYGVFDSSSAKSLFRESVGDIIATNADMSAAQSALAASGITASNYSFSISVRAEDEVHVLIAETVAAAWNSLGFKVSVKKIESIENDDMNKLTAEVATDIRDDIFNENFYSGDFEVIAIDYVVASPDPFSVLAPFAKAFAGQAINMETLNYALMPHITGYDNEQYNALIEEIFAEKDYSARVEKLHEAEKLLVETMPVIPIIFNQDAYVISDQLSKYSSSYYANRILTKLKLKNYELYIETTTEDPAYAALTPTAQ